MMKFLLTDSKGNKSVTMTAFVLGFLIVNIKFLLSGMTLGGLTIAPLSGVEYAAAIASLGSIYVLRRSTDPNSFGGNSMDQNGQNGANQ